MFDTMNDYLPAFDLCVMRFEGTVTMPVIRAAMRARRAKATFNVSQPVLVDWRQTLRLDVSFLEAGQITHFIERDADQGALKRHYVFLYTNPDLLGDLRLIQSRMSSNPALTVDLVETVEAAAACLGMPDLTEAHLRLETPVPPLSLAT